MFSVVSTIPKIVCETLAALGLQEEIPSWKIMDNKGKITVVLHWEKEHPPGQPPALQVGSGHVTVCKTVHLPHCHTDATLSHFRLVLPEVAE